MESFDYPDPQGDPLYKPEQFEDTFMGADFSQIGSPVQQQFHQLQHPQPQQIQHYPEQHTHQQQHFPQLYNDHTQPYSQSDSPTYDQHTQSQAPNQPQTQSQLQQQAVQQAQQARAEVQKRTRASGEVLALLISEFNKNQNPNAATRKRISEQTGMPERSVRIWFQNRRAKSRKLEKAAANTEKDDPYAINNKNVGFSRFDQIPLTLNNNYFFIDAKSLTVGSWKRLKSGNLSNENIFNVKNLSNLSPQSINEIMTNSTDLMLIISKKNFEINYFFSAITEKSKILFRIFYPISSVNNCSISLVQEDDGTEPSCELKLFLNKPPKFAVSFSHLIAQNNNQWSICDDFSEGHQVNDAFIGGSGVPHVFSGLEQSLKFMNSFILDYNSTNVAQVEFELPRPDSRSPTRFPISLHQQPQFPEEFSTHDINVGDDHQDGQSHIKKDEILDVGQNPLLEQFVQENMNFESFIKQSDDEFDMDAEDY